MREKVRALSGIGAQCTYPATLGQFSVSGNTHVQEPVSRESRSDSRDQVRRSTVGQTVIEKLTHEITQLKRIKFAQRSEQLSPDQDGLLDELIDTDIAASEAELEVLEPARASTEVRQKPTYHLAAAASARSDPSRTR